MRKSKKYTEETYKSYFGYIVYPDGRFVKDGKEVTYQKNGQISLVINNGQKIRIQGVRVLYSIYKNDNVPLKRNQIVVFLDGNKEHRHIDNLKCISKKEYDKMTRKQPRKALTETQVQEIRNLYELANDPTKNGNQVNNPVSYRKLATQYGVHFTTIQRVIQGSY